MTGSRMLPDAVQSVPEALAFWAEWTPERPALIVPGRRVITYRALWRGVRTFAESLTRAGIGRDDRVVLLVPEGSGLPVSLLGTMSVAIAIPLDAALTASELAVALNGLNAAGAVVTASIPAASRDCLIRHGVARFEFDPGDPLGGLADERQADKPAPPFTWPRPEDIAIVTQTSGTTGRPKRVPRAHGRIVESGRRHRDRFGLDQRDRALAGGPMTLSLGKTGLLHGLGAGSSLILPSSFDMTALWSAIVEERPTWMHTSAGLLKILARWLRSDPTRSAPSSLRFVRVTAAPIGPDICDELAVRLGTRILPGYSMSETGLIATALPPPALHKPGSVGKPLQVIRIVAHDAGVEPGSVGEIWVRGSDVIPRYLDDPELNATAFTADGWLRTGDVGYLDDDGFLFLSGRLKELINRGGAKISPAEVDAVLLAHAAVKSAATFAVPDKLLGEDIVAAIVAVDGAKPTPRELRTWMLDRLAPHKVPRRIWFVQELPLTPSGKVRRGELTRRWATQHA